MINRNLVTLLLSGLALGLAAPAIAADEPPHVLEMRDGSIEIRVYEPQIRATVQVNGSMRQAGNAGFRPLAGYIFGDNQARGASGSAEIAMTSPVTQQRSQEIAMTSPVTQQRSQEIAMTSPVTQSRSGGGDWQVSFIMPPEWTMETLPEPNDPRVSLQAVPARRMAVIRFSGGASDTRFGRKANELAAWLAGNGIEAIGEPVYARYDPPWVPTPFRRNEIMVEIAPG
ncbi:SOUL family heme-binding protein [Maricaulis sp.]|uniref:SOUL family heme-binding protein n=1 Tax=Maricaulis sp. TaxID=1486257 RepID=UPI003A936EF0